MRTYRVLHTDIFGILDHLREGRNQECSYSEKGKDALQKNFMCI